MRALALFFLLTLPACGPDCPRRKPTAAELTAGQASDGGVRECVEHTPEVAP